MKALRMCWLVKGKQDLKIGDNLKKELDDSSEFKSFPILDWNFNFEKLNEEIAETFKLKKSLDNGKTMINSNIYLCSETGTIRGIIPINKKES